MSDAKVPNQNGQTDNVESRAWQLSLFVIAGFDMPRGRRMELCITGEANRNRRN
jgi:hypothetical protein